ncbi:helix-turn-helix domain-containing protein [Kaistella palustris]|uniref:helix-turn-helix domain-containing protein n=1 Tax=Kaistella palustris TaxID=493376 RepID=UPI000413CC49|nr:AraC family transcriptional regulator [Kaistella palustris]
MLVFQVNSIPLKDVIISLAKSFKVKPQHFCGEYSLTLPEHLGTGEIRGINFENGLALLIYKVTFKEDIRLEFTLNEVHPVKFLNSVQGPLIHEFGNENKTHLIEEFKSAIVASQNRSGHIIEFRKDTRHEVVSVEIDRERFCTQESCELQDWNSPLKEVLTDTKGKKQFYHIASSGVYFKTILGDVGKYKKQTVVRKFNLQSITIQMFIQQLVQFQDDLLHTNKRSVLRIQELKRVEELGELILKNLADDHSIKKLSQISGLNPAKLQHGFHYLFGQSISEYITHARLERANVLLKDKEYSVRDVVAAIGLESGSYFSKIYKEKYGITPKKYKSIYC